MIDECYIVFYEGEDPIIEAPYFCITLEEAVKEYEKWCKQFPGDADRLYIAQIIKKPKKKGELKK